MSAPNFRLTFPANDEDTDGNHDIKHNIESTT